MSFFNKKWIADTFNHSYTCPNCGARMKFEDANEETLICTACGYDMDAEHYGFTDEEYESLYPSKEDVLGYSDEDNIEDGGEIYEEVYDELDD